MKRYHKSGCAVVWSRLPGDPVGPVIRPLDEILEAITWEFPGKAPAEMALTPCDDALIMIPRDIPVPAIE
ncbi:hypothetical protein KGO95_01690 [Patescibacteria group bacterium]|nr:hypothetical protein [Patescibacteria group bacterium]